MEKQKSKSIRILLVSDSTGATVNSIASTLRAQYPDADIEFDLVPFLRTLEQAEQLLFNKHSNANIIIHTLVDEDLIAFVNKFAEKNNIKTIELLAEPIQSVSLLIKNRPIRIPGQQYKVNQKYFQRINAVDFAMYTDDGHTGERLLSADVIIVGISRTSKTPTCIYLAYQGLRAANLPIFPNQELPKSFFIALKRKIPVVGLIASLTRLKEVRSNRLKTLGKKNLHDYVDTKKIQEELVYARLFFERHKIPVLDVTRRSVEETAAAVKHLIKK